MNNILIADDDKEDCFLIKKAVEKVRITTHVDFVKNGEEVITYFAQQHHRDQRPKLILLDLNMPRMDGREVLSIIKKDHQLKEIPVVILTTSQTEEDLHAAYYLGANSFITKPILFKELVKVIESLIFYWFHTVKLP